MATNILSHDRVIWTNIVEPTEADIQQLQDQYPQFHRLNLYDCQSNLEFPKLDQYQDYLFIVFQMPLWDESEKVYRPNEVDLFLSRGILVTSHDGTLQTINELFELAQTNEQFRGKLMGRGASPLLYELFQALVNACFPIMDKVNQDIRHIENHLFDEEADHLIKDIAFVRRDVIALRHIIRPQLDVLRGLEGGDWPFIQQDLTLYWKDIASNLLKLNALLDEQMDVINGLSDTIDTLASHRIDGVVRILTLITILTAPLTLIATIFGINVELLPTIYHRQLFLVVNLFGITLTVILLLYLRRRKWL